MKPIKIECLDQRELRIGWDGEHNWRPQTFDCSPLLKTRPNGTVIENKHLTTAYVPPVEE